MKENDTKELHRAWRRDTIIYLEGILPLQETMGERVDIRKEIRKLQREIREDVEIRSIVPPARMTRDSFN